MVLDNNYKVIEGGFSIGSYDDGSICEVKENFVAYSYKNSYSKIYTVSDTAFKYEVKTHAPGLHLLAPQSAYPAYITNVLDKGTYYFATIFYFTTGEKEEIQPEITLENNVVTVKYKDISKKIILE